MSKNKTTQDAAIEYGNEGKLAPFDSYFKDCLIVAQFPVIPEFAASKRYAGCDVVINVSDECYITYIQKLPAGCQSFWFPMGESGDSMGMNSIFGALYILYQCYIANKKVLLHCHAGANRSPVVQSCFHFMMIGDHAESRNTNMLIYNCGKHLPDMGWMENWLRKCKYAFDNPCSFIGGMFDWTMDDERIIKEE